MGNPCGTHMESATGIGMGPTWDPRGLNMGSLWANRYGSHIDSFMGPRWVTHVVPTWKVQPVLAWFPYGLRYGSNMGPSWAQYGQTVIGPLWENRYRTIMVKQISDHYGQTDIGPLWANRYRTIVGNHTIVPLRGNDGTPWSILLACRELHALFIFQNDHHTTLVISSSQCAKPKRKSGLMLLRYILTNYLISF